MEKHNRPRGKKREQQRKNSRNEYEEHTARKTYHEKATRRRRRWERSSSHSSSSASGHKKAERTKRAHIHVSHSHEHIYNINYFMRMNYTFFLFDPQCWLTDWPLCALPSTTWSRFFLLFIQLLNGNADHNKLNVIYGHHRIKRRQKWWQRVKASFHSFLWQATGEQSNRMECICDPAFNLFQKNIYLFEWIRQSMEYRRTHKEKITKKKNFQTFSCAQRNRQIATTTNRLNSIRRDIFCCWFQLR